MSDLENLQEKLEFAKSYLGTELWTCFHDGMTPAQTLEHIKRRGACDWDESRVSQYFDELCALLTQWGLIALPQG